MAVRRSREALALVVALVGGALLGGGAGSALALFTDTEQVSATTTASSSFTATTYYLHNNPTPPTGDTNAQANLSMNTTAPTATTLFNYDANQDSAPGRLIQRGGSGAGETTLARYQNWRGPTAGLFGQSINGTVTVEFWSAMPGFTQGSAGEVRVFLRDVDSVTGIAIEIANTTVSAADWQGGVSGWVKRSASFSVNHLLLVGHRLEVKLLVGSGAASDMMFAYDTSLYRSRVRLL
jgi:predicted ribosomally synthesized peptide with SipW-like signal peptide